MTNGCCLGAGPLDHAQANDIAQQFACLADPTRLRLLSLIAAGGCRPISAGELVEPLGVGQPTVSHHLKKLVDAGLLTRSPDGRRAFYAVNPGPFAELRGVLQLS